MDICSALTKTERAKIARELVQLLGELTAVSHDLCQEIELGHKMEFVRPARFLGGPIYRKHTLLLTPTGLIETSVEGTEDSSYHFYAGNKPPTNRNISSSEFEMVVDAYYYLNTTHLREVLNRIKVSRGDAA